MCKISGSTCEKCINYPKVRAPSCAAALRINMYRVSKIIAVPNENVYLFSDSMIVLGWLRRSPDEWKPFVANRVSKISTMYKPARWFYVKTQDNPADLATRGIKVNELLTKYSKLWLNGPDFINDEGFFMVQANTNVECDNDELPEARSISKIKACNVVEQSSSFMFDKFSSYRKMINVTAFVLRLNQ